MDYYTIVIEKVVYAKYSQVSKKFILWSSNFKSSSRRRKQKRLDRVGGEKNLTDLGWEIYPEGIFHVLKDLKRYNRPIYITENGLADVDDTKRSKFIKDHLLWIRRAMDEKVDVRGYFYWTLLDNFEWDKGFFWPRFGLVEVDFKTQQRRIRKSAFTYKKIIDNMK